MINKSIDSEEITSTEKCNNQNCDLIRENPFLDHCILHNNKRDKDSLLFKQALNNYVKINPNEYLDIHFPNQYKIEINTTNKVKFFNCTFYNEFNLSDSIFDNFIKIDGCTFYKPVTLSRIKFNKHALIRGCTFYSTVSFNHSKFAEGCFIYFNMFIQGANFWRVEFYGNSRIRDCTMGYSFFSGATIDSLQLIKCDWNMNHILAEERYSYYPINTKYGRLCLGDTIFNRIIYKVINIFNFSLNMSDRILKLLFRNEFKNQESLMLSGGQCYSTHSSYNALSGAESSYRLLKLKYKEQGEYDIAGKFAIRENIVKRKRKNLIKRGIQYWIYEMILGYGESPLRIITSALILIMSYATIYFTSKNVVSGNIPLDNVFESIYFSIVTFTTLGYGDYHPIGNMKYLASSEALLGGIMIAFFVVSLSRKFLR